MSGPLFNRVVQIRLGTRQDPNMVRYGNTGLDATPLRIGFEVKKNIKSAPNTGSVTIYNMSSANRNSIIPGMTLSLFAGYEDGLQLLFTGVVDTAKSKREGADITTTIECLDGAGAITSSIFVRRYAPGTRVVDILNDIAVTMAEVTGPNPQGMLFAGYYGINDQEVLSSHLSFGTTCQDALDKLCEPRDLEWSIQNGALQLLRKGSHLGNSAAVISPGTGLIGIPSINKDLCEFACLLTPNAGPGEVVYLDTRDIRGYFKIRGGKWTGDTHEGNWQCDLESVAMPTQSLDGVTNVTMAPAGLETEVV